MRKSVRTKSAYKALGLICALVMLIGALYVPLSFSASAANPITVTDDSTVVFGFEDSITGSNNPANKQEFDATRLGYCGWGGATGAAVDDANSTVLWFARPQQQDWATHGAYRVNKLVDGEYKVYDLKPNSTYVVSMKIRVISSSVFTDDAKTPHECYVSLGYGAKYITNDGNYASHIDKTLVKLVSTKAGSGVYTLTDSLGSKVLDCGNEWQEIVYKFTTPADLGTFDHALALFGMTRTSFRTEIDDLSVTKLGSDKGVAVLVDEYSGKTEIKTGKIGEELDLPDVSDRAQESAHEFKGWYKDASRTEKIEKLTYSEAMQFVYTGWKAPVTVTFVDELNGTSEKITGMAGEKFDYPADPVDPSDKSWFMGWFTSKSYTEEHTSGKFGYANAEIYAYFRGEIPGLVEDFENYPYCKKIVEDAVDTTTKVTHKKYTDSLIIGNAYTLQSDVTASESSKKALKLVWDSTKKKNLTEGIGVDDPDAYNAATRYHDFDNFIWLGNGIENGQAYTVTFKIKVEKAETQLEFYTLSAMDTNAWAQYVRYLSGYKTYEVSDEWQTVSFQFTTKFASATSGCMYLGVRMKENKDVVLYVDDVEIKAVAQPYEALVVLESNFGDEPVNLIGKRGEKIEFPSITHPNGAPFLGWYVDEACTEKAEITTFPRKSVTLYAKWGAAPVKFNTTYKWDSDGTSFYKKTLAVVNEKGIGYDDDYALKFTFKGSSIYNETTGVLMNTRFAQRDHVAAVAHKIKDGSVYKVSYYYKASNKSNCAATVTLGLGYKNNVWVNSCWNPYDITKQTISKGDDGWNKVEFYISASLKYNETGTMVGDTLFMLFGVEDSNIENYAELLIDDVFVEEIEAPYIFVEGNNGENPVLIRGTVGGKIELPSNIERFGHTLKGWYSNAECTEEFKLETYEADTAITVYAGWTQQDKITYSFEKYDVYNGYRGKSFFVGDAVINSKVAKTGKNSLLFGNRTDGKYNRGASYAAIAHGGDSFKLENGYMYIANVNYCVKTVTEGSLNLAFIGGPEGHFWAGQNNSMLLSGMSTITAGEAKMSRGKWINKTFVLDTAVLKEKQREDYTYLFLRVTGAEGWEIYFDDITITKVPKGQSAVCIENQGCKDIPTVLTGKPGASFASKLPENPKYNDMYFKGYYTKDAQGAYMEIKREDMKFGKEAINIYARFLDYVVKEDFESDYLEKGESYVQSYTTYDFDYEVYDATKEGNSKDNVTNGNFSLHRKGDSMYFENAVILTLGNQIAEGERYTVSFKVKLGEYKQTDGAIKVVSGRSFRYAWTTTGDYYPVIAIKDLLDGQWHEVSYTFNSVEAFACIQTPGYVELFMDEFKFSIAGDDTPLSTPPVYTEYVPAKRDAEGNLVEVDNSAIDVTTIIDISLYTADTTWIWIVAAAAVVLVAAGVIIALVLVKKKKQAKN